MRHFLVSKEACENGVVSFDKDDARHLATVLRMRPSQEIVISCEGFRYRCRLLSVSPVSVTAETLEELSLPSPLTPVTLVQAIPKAKKMDDIVRMATELGVDRIVPLTLSRCEANATPAKLDRWMTIALAADKQSRSLRFTELTEPETLDTLSVPEGLKLLLWEGSAPSLKKVLTENPNPSHVTILVGPEGGIDELEYDRLTTAGFLPVSLGPKILRTETAGVAALAVVHACLAS